MIVVEDVRAADAAFPYVVLTIGSFDGVHRGHRIILSDVVRRARAASGTAALLTLRPHPREFFTPDRPPNLLTTDAKKLELLEESGLDVVFFLPFTAEVAGMEPEAFIRDILSGRCHAREIVVGHDFCFGKDAKGNYALLDSLASRFGYSVVQTSPLLVDGERVSSTLIREQILLGNLDQAERFLGRKYSIRGEVVGGRGIGRKLGFPTANIKPHHSAVPAQGVYAAEALLNGQRHVAAVNIGIAPTIRHEDLTIEAFLLDFDGDILGREIELVFHKRLRPERKFPSYEALTEQIGRDVAEIRDYFAKLGAAG
jgi:riboflavin kinase/FMN adenylyltransferase